MYVCLCNGVTERDIRQAVQAGCGSMTELTMRTGCGSTCGSCLPLACELLAQAQAEMDAPSAADVHVIAFRRISHAA